MQKVDIAVGVVATFLTGLALAQTPGGAPSPSPEHRKLGFYTGNWVAEWKVEPNPRFPTGRYRSADRCEWVTSGLSVVCYSDRKGPMGSAKGVDLLGYSAEEGSYTYYGIDSLRTAPTTVLKGMVEEDDSWVFVDESRVSGKMLRFRYSIKPNSPRSYTFKWEIANEDGSWGKVLEGTATKQRACTRPGCNCAKQDCDACRCGAPRDREER